MELGLKFDFIETNNHVVHEKQRNFDIISNYSGVSMDFSFNNRSNGLLVETLGSCILDLITPVKGNVLIYFSSSSYLFQMLEAWKETNLFSRIEQQKTVFIESKNKEKNKINIQDFIKASRKSRQGVFLTVMRSSASEGYNFIDDYARLVVVCGVPYANFTGLKICLKRKFLNSIKNDNMFTWRKWYDQNAMSAVNQSLGRVIRHINDFGSMICIDSRFDGMRRSGYFCNWMLKEYMRNPEWKMVYNPVRKNANFFDIIRNNPELCFENKEEKEDKENYMVRKITEVDGKEMKVKYSFEKKEELKKIEERSCLKCMLEIDMICVSWCFCVLCEACSEENNVRKVCVICHTRKVDKEPVHLFQ